MDDKEKMEQTITCAVCGRTMYEGEAVLHVEGEPLCQHCAETIMDFNPND